LKLEKTYFKTNFGENYHKHGQTNHYHDIEGYKKAVEGCCGVGRKAAIM